MRKCVAPKTLQQVNLSGAIVIGNAMHAQREAYVQIVGAGGNYVWTVKGNQSRIEWAIEKLFVREVCNPKQSALLSKHCWWDGKVDKGHGRLEKSAILMSAELNDYWDWRYYVTQVFWLE